MATRVIQGGEQDGRDRVHHWWPMVFADVLTSTAIIVERRGQFRNAIAEGYALSKDWEVTLGAPSRRTLGGFHSVGVMGLDSVRHYSLRWKTSRMTDGVGEFRFYEKRLWYYTLRPTILYVQVMDAETKPGSVVDGKAVAERIPVTLEVLYTSQICNLYRVAYEAPDYWIEKAEVLIAALISNWVGTKTLDEIYAIKEKGPTQFWNEIKGDPLFRTLRKDWGWLVSDAMIKSVTPPDDIQKAGMEAKKQQMLAEAVIQETAGKWKRMVAERIGRTIEDVETMMKSDYWGFVHAHEKVCDECWNLVVMQTELSKGARFHVDVTGGSGPEAWIGLWRKLGQGGGGSQGGGGGGEKKKKKVDLSGMSSEELAQEAQRGISRWGKGRAPSDEDDE